MRELWLRLTCGRLHGALVLGPDQLWIECARCGLVSPGIVLDSHAIRLAWQCDRQRAHRADATRFDRHRARFRWRKAS